VTVKKKALVSAGDGLIPSGKTAPPTDISAARIGVVNGLHKRFVSTLKKGALIAFEIGKNLRDIWERLDAADSWPQWCKENLVFDVSTANKYLRIYENFKDNPKMLTGYTINGALKLLSAPKKEEGEQEEYGSEDKRPETPWEQYFELPPLSRKVKLDDHRFEIPNSHEVWLIRRGFNYPIKIAEVLAPEDKRLKSAHQGMLENIQASLEMYYQEVERIEKLERSGRTHEE
jgi:hypothetical protein